MEAAIMAIVIPFWKVMNTLLNTIFVCRRNVPRTISIGFTEEISMAGRNPAIIPVNRISTIADTNQTGVKVVPKSIGIFGCRRLLTKGTTAFASNHPTTKESIVSRVDSSISRKNNSLRDEPSKRRVAISFARCPAWATVRLI